MTRPKRTGGGSLASRLRSRMSALVVSLDDVAAGVNLPRALVRDYTTGSKTPVGTSAVEELSEYLGVRAEWLLTGDGPRGRGPERLTAAERREAVLRAEVAKLSERMRRARAELRALERERAEAHARALEGKS